MKSPIALLKSLLEDFQRLNPGVKGLDRDLVTIENRFKHEGYGFLAVALPALCDSLIQGLSTGRFTCPPGFSRAKGRTIPRLFSGMFREVFDASTGHLKDSEEFGVLRDLYQVLKVFKKVQLSPENEELLHNQAVDGFYQCDESASQVTIPDRHDHHIGRVCRLLLSSLETKEYSNAVYRHGPGAIAEGCKENQKWSYLATALYADNCLPEWTNLRGVFDSGGTCQDLARAVCTPSDFRLRGKPRNRRRSGNSESVPENSGSASAVASLREGKARLISVPKSSTSRRTITIEPGLNMFVQQGLNSVLRDSIKECPILSVCLDLTDQAKNQVLALEGSLHDNWATLDLKSASDLLSLTLVRSVFRHHPRFLEYVQECRSPFVSAGEKPLLTLGKFAGMGNATTFPVQSICFAVVCIAAILDSWGKTPTYWNVRRASRLLRVYGDDIIVSSQYAHQCVNWLQIVGLRVNDKKSFLAGNFKESCGIDAYKGINLTPAYCRFRPEDIAQSPNTYASFVSFGNHLWKLGLYSASTWVKDLVESSIGRRLPLVSSQSGVLGWHSRQDTVEVHKYCRHTHQPLTRAFALIPLKRKDKLDGYGALLKCLSGKVFKPPLNGHSMPDELVYAKDHLESTVVRFKTRMAARWVPALTRAGVNLEA